MFPAQRARTEPDELLMCKDSSKSLVEEQLLGSNSPLMTASADQDEKHIMEPHITRL